MWMSNKLAKRAVQVNNWAEFNPKHQNVALVARTVKLLLFRRTGNNDGPDFLEENVRVNC